MGLEEKAAIAGANKLKADEELAQVISITTISCPSTLLYHILATESLSTL